MRAALLAIGWGWAAAIVWLSLAPAPPKLDFEHGGGVEPRLVDELRRYEARAAHHFDPDRDAEQRVAAAQALALGDGEHRGNHDRAGVHRPALEGVVEVLAVRRGAVDEGGARGIERA